MTNSLYVVPVHIQRGSRSRMPAHLLGAFVECLVAAPDHLSAIRLVAKRIQEDGDQFKDLVGGKVHQLILSSWLTYFTERYPELADQLPAQPDLNEFMSEGGVFFGPYLASERE